MAVGGGVIIHPYMVINTFSHFSESRSIVYTSAFILHPEANEYWLSQMK